ncbi:MAG: hypothetical protein WC050_02680 [Candidatus Paceibacterota bacterium]
MFPIKSKENLPGQNCGSIRYCPHVHSPAEAKQVGCDDQGFGTINWVLTCDDPTCIAQGNTWIADNTIDWEKLKSGDRTELAKRLSR